MTDPTQDRLQKFIAALRSGWQRFIDPFRTNGYRNW